MKNNKQLFNDAIYFLTIMAFIYLLIGFAAWDLNAKNWSMEARVMYSFWGTLFSVFTIATKKIYDDSK